MCLKSIRKVLGTIWKKNIFDPFEMNSTNTSVSDNVNNNNVATPHFNKNEKNIPLKLISWDNMGFNIFYIITFFC